MTRLGGAAVGVVDECHDVAVVFGGVGRGWGEHRWLAVASLPNWCVSTVPCARSCLNRALLNASSAKSPLGWKKCVLGFADEKRYSRNGRAGK